MTCLIGARSGAVYSAFLFVLIGTYAADSPAMFIILDMVSMIVDPASNQCVDHNLTHLMQTAPVIVSPFVSSAANA